MRSVTRSQAHEIHSFCVNNRCHKFSRKCFLNKKMFSCRSFFFFKYKKKHWNPTGIHEDIWETVFIVMRLLLKTIHSWGGRLFGENPQLSGHRESYSTGKKCGKCFRSGWRSPWASHAASVLAAGSKVSIEIIRFHWPPPPKIHKCYYSKLEFSDCLML